jgi:hypothetical protein
MAAFSECPIEKTVTVIRRILRVALPRSGSPSRASARPSAGKPPILVISMPRSGSSWLGYALGSCKQSLYLREPLTQTREWAERPGSVFEVGPHRPPSRAYLDSARLAFTGIPHFQEDIVVHVPPWYVPRWRRRPVIKEVNLLALPWLLKAYAPRVVYLHRHPAAVAASFARLGWFAENWATAFSQETLRELAVDTTPTQGWWEWFGQFLGTAERATLRALEGHSDSLRVAYEELCLAPLDVFSRVATFCEIPSQPADRARFLSSSQGSGAGRGHPHGLVRESRVFADHWHHDLSRAERLSVHRGYVQCGGSLYGDEAWELPSP